MNKGLAKVAGWIATGWMLLGAPAWGQETRGTQYPFEIALVARQEALLGEPVWREVPELGQPDISIQLAWTAFDRRLEMQGKQTGGEEEVLLDSPKAQLARRRTRTGSIQTDYYAWATELIQSPLAMSVEGFPGVGTAADGLAVSNFVTREFLPMGTGLSYSVRATAAPLSSTDRVMGEHSGRCWPIPFDGALFFEIDDNPLSKTWDREMRYVFVRPDLSAYVVCFAREPVRIERGDGEIPLAFWAGLEAVPEEPVPEKAVRGAVKSQKEAKAVSHEGDASHSYAILFSGGGNRANNHTRYWGDMAAVYSTLTTFYGYSKSHIRVLMSDGTSSAADLSYYGEGNSPSSHGEFGTSSPLDLDGDGEGDVDYSATKGNLEKVFSSMAGSLGKDDQLFVFITDHGTKDDTTGLMCLVPWEASNGYITPGEFAAMCSGIACPIAFAMEFCYSGAFIPNLTAQKNRAVATAADLTTSSAFLPTSHPGFRYMNPWTWHFVAAMRGSHPSLTSTPWNGNGTACHADGNGDGFVSVQEAAVYAKAQIEGAGPYSEKPNYGESASGVGASLYLLKKKQTSLQTVTFDANGGSCSVTNGTYMIGGKYGTLPTATRSSFADWFYMRSYTFDGWHTAANGGTEVTETSTVTSEASRTLYAHWITNAAKQTVAFDANGGSCGESSRIYTVGQTYGSFPTPTWAGHDFDGWHTSATGGAEVAATDKVSSASLLRLYAHWRENKKPNLSFIADTGWSSVAFLTSAPGSTEAMTEFGTNDTIYLNFGYWNSGEADAEYYEFAAWVEDEHGEYVEESGWWDYTDYSLPAGMWFGPYTNADFLVKFAPGAYTAKIWLDSGKHLDESDETDNVISLPFTVGKGTGQELLFRAAGGEQAVTYTMTGLNYRGGGSDASWLHVQTQVLAQGNNQYSLTLTFTCDPNDGKARTATSVSVIAGTIYRFSITQEGAPTERANLTFHQRPDWTTAAFLTTQFGGTVPMSSFKTTDPVYLNFCCANLGTAPSGEWKALIQLIDAADSTIGAWEYDNHPLTNGYYRSCTNSSLGTGLAKGTYRVAVTLDWKGTESELDESDNQCVLAFTVADSGETAVPEIKRIALDAENGTFTLQFHGEAGKTYRAERAPELGGAWTKAGSSAKAGTGGAGTLTVPVPGTWNTGFFRVVPE